MLLTIIGVSTVTLLLSLKFYGTQSLVLLVIFGVIDLLAVLTIAGRTYLNTGVGCKDEALGLPSGSVRAIIALSLIIIFAIMALFMYTNLSPVANQIILKANQTVVFQNGTVLSSKYGGVVIVGASQAQQTFALQTLTTVSTLVVALAGFYFGTKAVSTAMGNQKNEQEDITIQSVSISSAQLGRLLALLRLLYFCKVLSAPHLAE